MILRLSQKLGKKIHAAPLPSLPFDANPLADWSSHLFTSERLQYILMVNSASLYTAMFYGRGVSDESEFRVAAVSSIQAVMQADGFGSLYQQTIAPATSTVQFSKALNRSITGSINDFVFAAKIYLTETDLTPLETSLKLNETPMSAIQYANPRKAMSTLGSKYQRA